AGMSDRLSFARPYISAHGKTIAVLVTTGIAICCNLLLLISFAMQLSMIMAAQQGAGLDMATAQANDTRQQIVSSLVLLTALASFVSLLVWIYAAHANLPALNAGPLEFSPGWAVGWFFIPIANLVKPYQAVVEIWKGSDPAPLRGPLTMS